MTDLTWPPETLDSILLHSLPKIEEREHSPDELRRYGRECAEIGLFNERAAVLSELDKLAREFDAAGRPKSAKLVRQTMEKINARLELSRTPHTPI
jgi:hypothetical protein